MCHYCEDVLTSIAHRFSVFYYSYDVTYAKLTDGYFLFCRFLSVAHFYKTDVTLRSHFRGYSWIQPQISYAIYVSELQIMEQKEGALNKHLEILWIEYKMYSEQFFFFINTQFIFLSSILSLSHSLMERLYKCMSYCLVSCVWFCILLWLLCFVWLRISDITEMNSADTYETLLF